HESPFEYYNNLPSTSGLSTVDNDPSISEEFLVDFFEDVKLTAMHDNRITIKLKDIQLVLYFRKRRLNW
ncbi:16239_t:CDS:2, partial [Entrophospora sp. SA101]